MKIVNKASGVPYEVTNAEAEKIKKSRIGKYFSFGPPAKTPPEVAALAPKKEDEQPGE